VEAAEDPELRFASKFAKYGPGVCTIARNAYRDRVWDVREAIEIAKQAKLSEPAAVEKFFRMHLYLVIQRAHHFLRKRHTFISEFEDYVSAGCLGVASGLNNFNPEMGYAPSNLLIFHIDSKISRCFSLLELPIHVSEELSTLILAKSAKEPIVFDHLAQRLKRTPSEAELLQELGIAKKDLQAYGWVEMRRLWNNRVEWAEPTEHTGEEYLAYREPFDQQTDDRELELMVRLQAVPPREREFLAMRHGLHPSSNGDPMPFEEIGKTMAVTCERARYLVWKARTRLRCNPESKPESTNAQQSAEPHQTQGNSLPKPPKHAQTATQYVNFLFKCLGFAAAKEEIHQSTKRYFPTSSVNVDRIRRKLESLARLQQAAANALDEGKTAQGQESQVALPPKPPPRPTPPVPTMNIRNATAYIEFLLREHGHKFSPEEIYEAVQLHFTGSMITEAQIKTKMRPQSGYVTHA